MRPVRCSSLPPSTQHGGLNSLFTGKLWIRETPCYGCKFGLFSYPLRLLEMSG
jgi:hypothetical protein